MGFPHFSTFPWGGGGGPPYETRDDEFIESFILVGSFLRTTVEHSLLRPTIPKFVNYPLFYKISFK